MRKRRATWRMTSSPAAAKANLKVLKQKPRLGGVFSCMKPGRKINATLHFAADIQESRFHYFPSGHADTARTPHYLNIEFDLYSF